MDILNVSVVIAIYFVIILQNIIFKTWLKTLTGQSLMKKNFEISSKENCSLFTFNVI